jgi:hypothetical protein
MSDRPSTESDILGNIPGIDDVGGGDIGGDVGGSQGGGDTGLGGGTTSAQPGDDPRSRGGAQQQDGAVRRRHDGLVEVPNEENPSTRDLVDPVTGRRVAQGGVERRIYEEGQRHARENTQLKQQLQNAMQQLGGINNVTQEAVRLGLPAENQLIALRVMADFMRDPVKTLEYMVQEVKSKGYQIPFLEQGISPGMDMAAIARMIDQKFLPLTQQRQQQEQRQRFETEAKQELDRFLGANEDAHENLDVIAEMLQAQQGLGIQDAYIKMMRWAVENGLDPRRSLKQQIAAAQQQPTQQPNTRPLPNGRSATGGVAQRSNGATQMHNENASWSDIIRDAMHEHGVSIN